MRQLVKIKQRMADNLEHLPNYTCTATIERFRSSVRFQSTAKEEPWESVDVQQVEVALVGDKEWFSRPGAGRLETHDLRDLIPSGLVSSGDYANHARAVFASNLPRFEYAGTEDMSSGTAVRFRYVVSLLNSGYHIRSGATGANVAFHGTFWADASSGDLLRLDLVPDDIPLETKLAGASTTVEYARMRIGDADFLLPRRTELTVARRLGSAERNRMTFAQCRQYLAESTVSFQQPDRLPAGLALTLALDADIDADRLRGGAAVFAKLVSEVRNPQGLLIPAHAVVRGRVLQAERQPGPPPMVGVILEFDEIVANEHHFHFNAVLERVNGRQRVRRTLEPNPRPGVISLLVQQPVRLGGLVSTWRTQ